MGSLAAHSCGAMDRQIIWEIALTDIPVLKAFCDEQLGANQD